MCSEISFPGPWNCWASTRCPGMQITMQSILPYNCNMESIFWPRWNERILISNPISVSQSFSNEYSWHYLCVRSGRSGNWTTLKSEIFNNNQTSKCNVSRTVSYPFKISFVFPILCNEVECFNCAALLYFYSNMNVPCTLMSADI